MKLTPVREQYLRIKQKYPETIVLFRLGDFYEAFDEDAMLVSHLLDITLTSREMGKGHKIPMAGGPHHALNNYLGKLISHGHKVAICEQLSPPGNGLVERDVVRVATPGTIIEPSLLDGAANNYLASIIIEGEEAGLAHVDITTAEFATTQLPTSRLLPELERLHPSEVLLPRDSNAPDVAPVSTATPLDVHWFDFETANQILLEQFGVTTLEGYGCAHLPLAVRAAGAIIHYLQESQRNAVRLLTQLTTYSVDRHMILDGQTLRNLDIFRNGRTGLPAYSLLSAIDATQTAMGSRLLKKWLGHPLLDLEQLTERQDNVEAFCGNHITRTKVTELLHHTADLERLINRVSGGHANPKELVTLRRSLELVPEIRQALEDGNARSPLTSGLQSCDEVVALISRAIAEDPPLNVEEGGVIKQGFSPELDELRQTSKNARQYLANLERQERERTGIKSLRVAFNKVFGYYIEVSNAHLAHVPADYMRKQTLVGGERFFTAELKEHETHVLNAKERTSELESSLFRQVCHQVSGRREEILRTADALANLDVFSSLAETAARHDYHRPKLTSEDAIIISNGRHPVVEQSLNNESFIANDTHLSNKDSQIIILTGPNMCGKSTYLRQVAVIVLLAQIGSFVPAEAATIGLVDRIFTRIGAQEDLAAGQSTFMVEMVETANILNNSTSRSLVILDEIGRGTSTYDGLSIAHAVVEYIHNNPKIAAKTLFATHYHEMVDLAAFLPRVKNFNIAATEDRGKVVFLRKVIPGGADKSYGIHVAQLAGMPKAVLHRAQEILADLEGNKHQKPAVGRRGRQTPLPDAPLLQLTLFGERPPVLDEILKLDLESLTPLDALNKLYQLQTKARESDGQEAQRQAKADSATP
ncbi:MAG: DNA mismatch repair protein MutS [Chloroflexi bacterium]|nr:DNA mismatch repair protein MutS [Chloroflexota bacterium]